MSWWLIGQSAHKFRVFNFAFDFTQPFTFWAGLFGGMVLNTATHGADQMMVQRYLSARSQQQAALALIASGFVILAQFAFFLLIGVGLFVFYQAYPPPGTPLAPDDAFASFIVGYLPVGIKGLVIAAIFAAAMGTLSGSLNASASTMVNDLYRPITGCTDERRLLRISRILTVVWGLVQMAVAFGATRLQDSVVNNALAIASFATGILLGLFLLGILTRRVGQQAALAGMVAGISAVSFAKFGTALAWPWYALVGSSTVFAVGLVASRLAPRAAVLHVPDPAADRGVTTMTMEDTLLTESRNPRSEAIDTLSARADREAHERPGCRRGSRLCVPSRPRSRRRSSGRPTDSGTKGG